MSQMSQPSQSSSPTDVELLLSITTAQAMIEKHAPEKDKALLHAMLDYAPTDNGKLSIARHILQSVDSMNNSALDKLADSYWINIILAVRSAGGKTPAPSQNPSRGDPHGGETPFNVESAKRNQKYLKKHTLARDDYRCLATGRIESQVIVYKPNFARPQNVQVDVTQAAHIIPFSLNDFDNNDARSLEQKTIIWTALQAFCGKDISALKGSGINSIDNVMTLSYLAHKYFGELQLAFEPIPNGTDQYKLLTFGEVAPTVGFPDSVTLKSHNGLALPNPFYLEIHCAICKVLWASGRGETLEQLLRDWEDTTVLAKDGSSGDLLNLAIYRTIKAY